MLRIREDQYAALNDMVRRQFVERAREYFRREWDEECADMSDEELEQMVVDARGRAESYGIDVEADVIEYAEFWLVYGADFERSESMSEASEILNDRELNGRDKLVNLRIYFEERESDA